MVFAKPTVPQIKKLATEQSFERGRQYYKTKCVMSARITNDTIIGMVSGTYEYAVRISENFNCHCTCPYNFEGICKHAVAVLLHALNNFKQMKKDETDKKHTLEKMLSGISANRLKGFLRNAMQQNEDLEMRFAEHFEIYRDMPQRDYQSEINSMYENACEHHSMIEYGNHIERFHRIARLQEKSGNYLAAWKIYQGISEAITKNMDRLDDSDGYYEECFSDAISAMASCISMQTISHKEKQQYISYLFEKYIKNETSYFRDEYMSALRHICISKDDHAYWKSLLEPHMPEQITGKNDLYNNYLAREKILMQIYILEKLDDISVQDIYTAHYLKDEQVCLSYIDHLQKTNPHKVPQILHQVLKRYPRSTQLKETAISSYDKKDSKYYDMVLEMYFETLEPRYYSELKALQEWSHTLEKIIQYFSKLESHYSLVDVYLTEKMNDKAIHHITSSKNLNLLAYYRKRLATLYPQEYFEAYCSQILEFAASNVGRNHYRKVKSHLKNIRTIPRHKRKFQILVDTIREQNSTKPAFLDELNDI